MLIIERKLGTELNGKTSLRKDTDLSRGVPANSNWTYAPINVMPDYPPPGHHREQGGDLTN